MEVTITMPDSVLERDVSVLAGRFDRHLEIYAQNGKELSAVKTNVSNLEKKIDTLIVNATANAAAAVTQDQFWPIRMLVYGTVGVMLLGMMGWIGTTLLEKSKQVISQDQMNEAATAAALSAVQKVLDSVQTQVN